MAQRLSPPPYHEKDISSYVWQDWFNQFRTYVVSPSDHNNLNGLQGGSALERYHLTNAQVASLNVLSSLVDKINYEFTYQQVTPVTGATITFSNNKAHLLIKPLGPLATLTITLPANPFDGQTVIIDSTQSIATLTLNASQTIFGSTTSLTPNVSVKYIYITPDNTWYKL